MKNIGGYTIMSIIRTNINDQINNNREYFNEVEREIGFDLLTPKETIDLFIDYRENGNLDARDQLIKKNLRLVNRCAINKMLDRHELGDLIQEGNIGLIKAIDCYDYKSDVKFSSYAFRSISQHISRYIYSNRTIRIPEHLAVAISEVKRLECKLGRTATLKEAQSAVKSKAVNVMSVLEIANMTMESYDYVENPETGGDSVLDSLISSGEKDHSQYLVNKEIEKEFYNILVNTLEERELLVIINRFGITGEKPKTLAEVGVMIDRSREIVRRVEKKSLEKLRTYFKYNNIKYLDFVGEEII